MQNSESVVEKPENPKEDRRTEPGDWTWVTDAPHRGGEVILLVEDEAFVRDVTREILKNAGYAVLTCRSAVEGVSAFNEHHGEVDLLLTDVILPGESGYTLAQTLRLQVPALKVLFMTGYAEQIQVGKAERTECLAKPFSSTVLLAKLREMLDRRDPLEFPTSTAEVQQENVPSNPGLAS